jgi:hypothetical protein
MTRKPEIIVRLVVEAPEERDGHIYPPPGLQNAVDLPDRAGRVGQVFEDFIAEDAVRRA